MAAEPRFQALAAQDADQLANDAENAVSGLPGRAPAPDGAAAAAGGEEGSNVITVLAEGGAQCAAAGDDCSGSKTCCDSSLTCYQKNQFWATCKASCDAETPDEFDGKKWSCQALSGGGAAGAAAGGAAATGGAKLPLCSNVSDTACLKAKCSIADGGPKGDCMKTWCCSVPGTQCYEQNDYWASCKPSCDPNGKTEAEGKGWRCIPRGPRTPGDSHSWKPCPKEAGAEKIPLLVDGDIPSAWEHAERRATNLLNTLELDDKVALLRGQNDAWPNDRHGYAGYVNPNYYFRNKCAMPLMLNDGPQGYNHYQQKLAGTTTQFPALLSLAASFDPEVARSYAAAISKEFTAKGANVMLGPDVEVGRNTLSGRAFETLSGEDPFLGSQLVKPFVEETLKEGIIVTVKHWLDNNEEDYRMTMNVEVSERAQHEIYMPVFKAAIEAGAGAVMCSYQKVGGIHACENAHILKKLLREDLGFRGFVMSDWGATHDAERSAENGLDMEMPGGATDHYHKLPDLVRQGKISEKTIDEMASHVLSSMYASGHFDGQFKFANGEAALDSNVTSDEHRLVARKTIADSAVLLKNEGVTLPLSSGVQKVAMVGKYCKEVHDKSYGQGDVYSAGGSGYVMSNLQVTPLAGVKARFADAEVTFSASAKGAEGADVAVVCASAHAEEGWDRPNLTMPEAADLVSALRLQSPLQKIVVLAVAPGAVTTEWLEQADAGLLLFMPGEQIGAAVADLLSGDAAPGGRLPVSLPHRSEHRFTPQQYPGAPFNDVNMTTQWSEGTLVGYRWNDAMKQPSAFPFGFGLAYTSFTFGGFQATCTGGMGTVSLTITNAGARNGAAVPQIYVGFPSLTPVLRQLRGFKKVLVDAGEISQVSFSLDESDWSFWSESTQAWQSALTMGESITVSVGTSSADLLWSKVLPCSVPATVV